MSDPKRIIVVDDEHQITRVLRRILQAHRYDVRTAADGESGLDLFADFRPDLVITDLSMPLMDGIAFCRGIRRISGVPIIVLSVRGEEATKVSALDAGADDYVTKPFGTEELLARVRAALRRAPPTPDTEITEIGDFLIDPAAYRATVRGTEIHLTPKEFELLLFLVRNEGKVLTHRALLTAVWGANSAEQPEYLRVFVGNLRKKVEENPSQPRHILTEPWIGYRFNAS